MVDRRALRLSAVLLVAGLLLSLAAGQLHPARENPNDHPAVFAEYAADPGWTAVHLGQFAGMALIVAGLLALYFSLDLPPGTTGWVARLGAVSSSIALGLYAVLQAVDGVALKRAVDAWVAAPEAEKAARFASAEAVRWLEEAVRSYQDILLGLAFVLLGAALVRIGAGPASGGHLDGAVRPGVYRPGLGARR